MYDLKALYEARTVRDAVRLRLEYPQAQILAGGTDVLVQMRGYGASRPVHVQG